MGRDRTLGWRLAIAIALVFIVHGLIGSAAGPPAERDAVLQNSGAQPIVLCGFCENPVPAHVLRAWNNEAREERDRTLTPTGRGMLLLHPDTGAIWWYMLEGDAEGKPPFRAGQRRAPLAVYVGRFAGPGQPIDVAVREGQPVIVRGGPAPAR